MALSETDGRASRSLLPKEHGAYGQVLFPLATAFVLGGVSLAAALLALAAVLVFLAHEPVLVLLGHRGGRAQREHGRRALGVLLGLSLGALGAGLPGLWRGGTAARETALLPCALGLAMFPVLLSRRERTLPGEVLAGMTLASLAVPVARAAGATAREALACWLAWGVGFVLTTLGVRAVTQARRDPVAAARARWATYALAPGLLALLAALGAAGALPRALPLALLPLALASALATRASLAQVRSVGWGLVSASALTAALLAVCARGA
jgi:hypothetical protein